MDSWQMIKRKAGRYAVIVIVLMILSSPIARFIGGYLNLGTIGTYLWTFVAMFVLLAIADPITKTIFEVN